MATKKDMDMTNGPLLGKIFIFAIPVILSGVLQLLFNAADTIVVGRYAGSDSLAAVGSTTSIISLLVNFFVGISIGVNAVTAMLIGNRDNEGISETVHTAMVTSVISGLILVFIGVVFTKPILIIMGSPENVLAKSVLYLRIYFLGMPVMMLYNFGSAVLRAFGDTKSPLIYLCIGGIVNVLLNLVFVIIFDMDVAGVGVATIVAQCISAFLTILKFIKTDDLYKIHIKKLKIHKKRLAQIFKIGIPAGLQSSVFSVSNMIIQSSVNSFGAAVMAGNAASSSLDNMLYIALNAFNQASLTFTSQNYGAGKIKRIKKVLIDSEFLVIIIGIALGAAMAFKAEALVSIYSKDPEVIKYGLERFYIMCATYFLCGMMDTFTGVLRGIGYSLSSMIISIACVCGVRLMFVFTYFPYHRTFRTIFISYPLSWFAAIVLETFVFVYAYRKLCGRIKNKEGIGALAQ